MSDELAGLSRADLVAEVRRLRASEASVRRDHDAMLANLGHVQARCTELLDLYRASRHLDRSPPGELHIIGQVAFERRNQDSMYGLPESLLSVPDGTGEQWRPLLDRVRLEHARHCEETGRETCCFAHPRLEECLESLVETDPKLLRAESVQEAAIAVRHIEVIDRRAAR